MVEEKPETLICDCGEGKKLTLDEAQILHVTSPRAERDWVVCRQNTQCHQKVQAKIDAVHNPVEEVEEPKEVPAPPVAEPTNDLEIES